MRLACDVNKSARYINRVPIDHGPAARVVATSAGDKDCETAGVAQATTATRKGFPDPADQLRTVSLALDRRVVRVPSPVRRSHRFARDTVRSGRGRSARRRSHFVARRVEHSEMGCPQRPLPMTRTDSSELMEKPAALVEHCRKAESEGLDLRFGYRRKAARSAQHRSQESVTPCW